MARLVLRPYQLEAVAAHYDWFAKNPEGNPLFILPTGAGKSVCIAEFIKRTLTAWPGQRVLVLTHVKELISQNHAEFVRHWSDETPPPCGIYSAGMNRRETRCTVLFAGIQSIYGRAEELGWFDVVLIDECHLIPKKGLGRYRTYLEALEEINPRVRVCGYTATHYRMEGGYLHKGEGRIFTDVAYEVSLEELVAGKFLVPLVAKACKNVIDTSDVATVRGDFKASELEEAAIEVVEAAVFEMVMVAGIHDRRHWLVFASGVEHAKTIARLLFEQHVQVATVFGDTPSDERERVITQFREGNLTALVNVGVLTTGFNAPCCDLMAVMRPTKSTSLYVQMAGRGMRTHPDKANCLYLDYGENVARHGPINKVRPQEHGGSGEATTKVCPKCASIVALGVRTCPDCEYAWPWEPPVRTQTVRAADLDPFDPSANEPRVLDVRSMYFRRHEKEGKPDSLRVDFMCGMRVISTWVCIEHEGFAGRKAGRWWFEYGGSAPIPDTVTDAIARQGEIRMPQAIEVVDDGDFERVNRPLFRPEVSDG